MNQDLNQFSYFLADDIKTPNYGIEPNRNINSTTHNLDDKSTGTIYFTTFLFLMTFFIYL